MKKLRIKKEYGIWYYKKIVDKYSLDAPIYELYDCNEKIIASFGAYYQMAEAIKYGNIEEYIKIYG